jgi:hypothetical protein
MEVYHKLDNYIRCDEDSPDLIDTVLIDFDPKVTRYVEYDVEENVHYLYKIKTKELVAIDLLDDHQARIALELNVHNLPVFGYLLAYLETHEVKVLDVSYFSDILVDGQSIKALMLPANWDKSNWELH